MERHTLSQIRESFAPGLDRESIIYTYVVRPLSFLITFILLQLGIRKPNQVTILGLFFGLIGIILFISPQRIHFCLGVLFYILFLLFDFADGNIARITDSATYYGKFLDGAVDALIEVLLPFSIGIGLYLSGLGILFLFIGGIAALILMFGFFMVNRAAFFNRWVRMEVGSSRDLNPLRSTKLPLKKIGNILTDIKMVTLLIGAAIGINKFLYIIFLVSVVFWALSLIIVTMSDAAEGLNIHRISKWDPRRGGLKR